MSCHLGAGGAAQDPVPLKKPGLAWKTEAWKQFGPSAALLAPLR